MGSCKTYLIRVLTVLKMGWRWAKLGVLVCLSFILAYFVWLAIANSHYSTPRNFAGYRTFSPLSKVCRQDSWSSPSPVMMRVNNT